MLEIVLVGVLVFVITKTKRGLSLSFPDDWKCARVTPLFNQGERTDVN